MTKDKIRKYFIEHYNLEIEDLIPLWEFASMRKKELSIYKKSVKKRKAFFDETVKKWKETTEKIFRDTDVKLTYYQNDHDLKLRNSAWRVIRYHGVPEEAVSRIFNEIKIQELQNQYTSLYKRVEFISMIPPLNWLVLNLACLFPHTKTTVVNKALHLGDVNWKAVLYAFEFWRPTGDLDKALDDGTRDAFRKRYEEAKHTAEKKFGGVEFLLDPKVKEVLKDRERHNKIEEEVHNRLAQE